MSRTMSVKLIPHQNIFQGVYILAKSESTGF